MLKNTEDLLIPDDNRFVMFPIKHDDIWKMYEKQIDCFWRPQEIDLSNLAKGTYLLKFNSLENSKSIKVIKQ